MWIQLLRQVRHLTTVFPSVKHHYTIITQSQNNHNGSLRCNYTNLSQEADRLFGTVRSRRVISIVPAPYNLMPSGPQDLLQAAILPYEHWPTLHSWVQLKGRHPLKKETNTEIITLMMMVCIHPAKKNVVYWAQEVGVNLLARSSTIDWTWVR